jgi:hypothetical protein
MVIPLGSSGPANLTPCRLETCESLVFRDARCHGCNVSSITSGPYDGRAPRLSGRVGIKDEAVAAPVHRLTGVRKAVAEAREEVHLDVFPAGADS